MHGLADHCRAAREARQRAVQHDRRYDPVRRATKVVLGSSGGALADFDYVTYNPTAHHRELARRARSLARWHARAARSAAARQVCTKRPRQRNDVAQPTP